MEISQEKNNTTTTTIAFNNLSDDSLQAHHNSGNIADEEIQNRFVHDKSPETGEISEETAFKNLNLEERDSKSQEKTVATGEDVDEVKLYSDVYDDEMYQKEMIDNGIEGSEHRGDDDSDVNLTVQPDENDNPEEGVNREEEVVSLLASNSGKYRRPTFPVRLDAEDCAFYIRNGTCKFGSSCKFNHPPWRKNQAANDRRKEASTDRPGQTECKYHMKAGGCKYGNTCRYNHSGGRAPIAPILQFNFLGLPIRLEEKDCHYYMCNGTCKYGSNCMFNHPDPSAQGSEPHSGYSTNGFLPLQGVSQPSVSSWSSARALNETGPMPIMFSPTQLSTSAQWGGYQATSAYPTAAGDRSLSGQAGFALNNSPMAETTNSLMYNKQPQIVPDEYPERPGLPECSYFMKTGQCKYRSACKFHHPKNNQTIPNITSSGVLSEKGLPQRPEKPICTHYGRYGICKYGPACKYDHPVNYTPSASMTGHVPPSTTVGSASGSGVGDGIPRV
ncbi:zinc finger CCCH domain-containing protein 67-like [Impatiens glandulifera]|uniref:zinc finger CCCH domain-containing protein 67-like n=1 Tax=Impatiens glandulifera TaxID=253017 RepID=UPI001FB07525|nr:zinc finger CCCH domain-containing protein 67-like [Impatiens glandulifera]